MIGVAVLGAGRIGKIHARNVTLNPRCKLVAVADPIKEAAAALAGALGAEAMTDARGDDCAPRCRCRRHRHADRYPCRL